MYVKRLAEAMVISSALWKDDRTSRLKRSSEDGWDKRRYVAPDSKVAVVSDPAATKTEALDKSRPSSTPYNYLSTPASLPPPSRAVF